MTPKTVGQKLFIKKGMTLRLISAPDNFADSIRDPDVTFLSERSKQPADLVLLFTRNRNELEAQLDRARKFIVPSGALWLAYPKATLKLKSDIHRDSIREYAASIGLNTVSLISIDEVWSCFRLKPVRQE